MPNINRQLQNALNDAKLSLNPQPHLLYIESREINQCRSAQSVCLALLNGGKRASLNVLCGCVCVCAIMDTNVLFCNLRCKYITHILWSGKVMSTLWGGHVTFVNALLTCYMLEVQWKYIKLEYLLFLFC